MELTPGLDVQEEHTGHGPAAQAGDAVRYDCRILLNRGDEVAMAQSGHETILGKRRVIAGIERALTGMQAGGFRKVRVSPHLAYGDTGVPNAVPPSAVLVISLWLTEIVPSDRLA
ncbi:MAG: FKBP-type peptidyl-prolyl cis-trans isomerase [Hyphomicrobiaceae bacterium]